MRNRNEDEAASEPCARTLGDCECISDVAKAPCPRRRLVAAALTYSKTLASRLNRGKADAAHASPATSVHNDYSSHRFRGLTPSFVIRSRSAQVTVRSREVGKRPVRETRGREAARDEFPGQRPLIDRLGRSRGRGGFASNHLAKVRVAGSSPVARSSKSAGQGAH
jgi:hypothetical protein